MMVRFIFGVLLVWLFSVPAFAQRTVTLFPSDFVQPQTAHVNFSTPNGDWKTGWFQLQPPTGASGNGSFDVKYLLFKMPGNVERNSYSGNADLVIRVDTTSVSGLAVGDRDSLYVSAKPLFWDFTQKAYELSAQADEDSIVVGSSTGAGNDWGTTHSDQTHFIRADMDVQLCNAILVTVYVGRGAPVDVRALVRISYQEP